MPNIRVVGKIGLAALREALAFLGATDVNRLAPSSVMPCLSLFRSTRRDLLLLGHQRGDVSVVLSTLFQRLAADALCEIETISQYLDRCPRDYFPVRQILQEVDTMVERVPKHVPRESLSLKDSPHRRQRGSLTFFLARRPPLPARARAARAG